MFCFNKTPKKGERKTVYIRMDHIHKDKRYTNAIFEIPFRKSGASASLTADCMEWYGMAKSIDMSGICLCFTKRIIRLMQ